jgi:hypothetical protein
MRRFSIVSLSFAFIIAGAAGAQVPMEQEPHHHLVFENGALRVLEPTIPAGETTLEHLHSNDAATVCISGSRMRSQRPGASWTDPGQPCKPGEVNVAEYAGKPSSHTVQNVGTNVFQLVDVENLREKDWSIYLPLSAGATELVKQTRAFQIYEVKLDRSSPESRHIHKRPTILVLVSGDVTAGIQRLDQPGQWLMVSGGEPHTLITQHDARIVEIEVR